MTSARGCVPPVVFLEKNEHNGHQYTKVREGYNLAATAVDQIPSLNVPSFVKPTDNQVDHGGYTHEQETYN